MVASLKSRLHGILINNTNGQGKIVFSQGGKLTVEQRKESVEQSTRTLVVIHDIICDYSVWKQLRFAVLLHMNCQRMEYVCSVFPAALDKR